MTAPTVSLVLPVYNSAAFLAEAIESALAQTFADFEFLISDDGSTDETLAIISRYADPRIKLVRNDRGRGIFQNLNSLCQQARGEFIKLLCADDVLAPTCLERMVGFLVANPAAGVAWCFETTELDSGRTAPPKCHKLGLPDLLDPASAAIAFYTFGNLPGYLSKLMLRRGVYQRLGPFREDLPYAADFEYWWRAASASPLATLREELVAIRYHPAQASATLNRANELTPQVTTLINAVRAAIPAGLAPAAVLRWHGTMLYTLQQVHWTVRACLRGRFGAIRRLRGRRGYSYPLPVAGLLYGLTFNGRIGRDWSTRRLLQCCRGTAAAQPVARLVVR